MKKIKIDGDKFTCPMLNKELFRDPIDKSTSFGVCGKCKYNILGQILDNEVCCNYGSSSGGGGGGGDDGGGSSTDPDDPTPQPYYPDLDVNGNGEPDEFWEEYNH